MYGNWRVNLTLAGVGAIIIFLIAFNSNTLMESFLRAIYSFIMFGVIVYSMQYIINTFIFPKPVEEITSEGNEDVAVSQKIDLHAIDVNENLQDLLKQQLSQAPNSTGQVSVKTTNQTSTEEAFKPLKPTQLFSNKTVQPEEMSKAIRHLTGE